MPYTITEAVQDTAEDAKAFAAIAKLYPDAWREKLPGHEEDKRYRAWVSDSVVPTHVAFHGMYLCPYVVVETKRVYVGPDRWRYTDPEDVLRVIGARAPALYKDLVGR